MAKKLVKKAATAASKKPAKKPAKPATSAKASSVVAKLPAKVSKPSAISAKASAKPVIKAAGKPAAQVKSKTVAVPAKIAPAKAKPAAAKVAVAASTKTDKAAVKNGVVEKPITNGKTMVVSAKAPVASAKAPVANGKVAGKSTATVVIDPKASTTKVVEAPKPTGRPMLLQGPIAARPMGKKATLPITPDKPKIKVVKKRLPLSDEPKFVIVQPPTKAVATSEKAAKNKAGFGQKDLDFFRDLLLAKRRELLGDMNSMEREALRENSSDLSNLPVHMADQGTDAYEQEFTLHLVEKDRGLLRELNDALAKIQNGTYGICEGTGLPISKPRLEAQPWARHSIEHARALEKRQGMFRR